MGLSTTFLVFCGVGVASVSRRHPAVLDCFKAVLDGFKVLVLAGGRGAANLPCLFDVAVEQYAECRPHSPLFLLVYHRGFKSDADVALQVYELFFDCINLCRYCLGE